MKPRTCLSCIVFLAGMFTLSMTSAAPITDTDIDKLVKAEAPPIARQWNLVPLFRITDGTGVEMTPAGTIELGRTSLRTILNKVDISKQQSVIRWIIAHETWHQAQRRDYGQMRKGGKIEQQLLECEADIMAAEYMTTAYLTELGKGFTLAKGKELGSATKSIINELQATEQNFSGTIDHPTGPQRRNAIALGNIRGLLEHTSLVEDPEEREAFIFQVHRVIDYKDNERIQDWAARTCNLILHAGNGVSDLTELRRVIQFNENGDPPIVDFQLPYKNTGNLPISVVMQVMTLAVPRASPEDADSWQKVDAVTERFDLAPGQQYTVSGRLLWIANEDAFPRLLFPLNKDSMYSAVRGEALPPIDQNHSVSSELSPRLRRLALSLLTIANAAPEQFKSIRAPSCHSSDGDRICPLTVTVPSAEKAEITYEANGATSVDIMLYEGKNEAVAKKTYADFKNDLQAIDPFKSYRERPTSSGGTSLSLAPTSTSKLDLRLTRFSSGGFHVGVTIVPSAYSE